MSSIPVCDVCRQTGTTTPARIKHVGFDPRECFGELFPSDTNWLAKIQFIVIKGSDNFDLCDEHALPVIEYLRDTITQAIEDRDADGG
tara:strand:- start:4237 stop:4500 length:264 start_codon:yes stop_codon:yes gene_type:complete